MSWYWHMAARACLSVHLHSHACCILALPPGICFACLLCPRAAMWQRKATMFSPAVFQHHYIASPNATFHVTSKHILYPFHVPAWLTHLPSSMPPCGGSGMHLHAYHLPVAPGSTGIPVQVDAVSQHDRLTARADLPCSLSAM